MEATKLAEMFEKHSYDDLKQPVDPADIYHNTEVISGKPGQPQTLEDSFRAATVYGVRTKTQPDALKQRMAPRFEVQPPVPASAAVSVPAAILSGGWW